MLVPWGWVLAAVSSGGVIRDLMVIHKLIYIYRSYIEAVLRLWCWRMTFSKSSIRRSFSYVHIRGVCQDGGRM